VSARTDGEIVRAVWDLDGLVRQYRTFLRRYEPRARRPHELDPLLAFGLRFALVFDYLEIAWSDPELPAALLPDHWPGARARDLAGALYRALLPGAVKFGEDVLSGRASG
jgi:phenylacetic acid degradation operon negative regulatory protein